MSNQNSDIIEIHMTGGTAIRIPAGRGEGKPYDLLLQSLKVCQHWDEEAEAWCDGDPFEFLNVIRVAEPKKSQP